MDFGVDRLIDMFEERFGRTSATSLLGLIGLGAAGWAFGSIYTNILKPFAKLGALISTGQLSEFIHHIHSLPHNYLLGYCYGIFVSLVSLALLDFVSGRLFEGSSLVALLFSKQIRFLKKRIRWSQIAIQDYMSQIRQLEYENADLKEQIKHLSESV